MAKLIEQDGRFFRFRRGKLVEIPPDWVGHTTFAMTIRKRPSKKDPKRAKWERQWGMQRERVARGNNERRAIAEYSEDS